MRKVDQNVFKILELITNFIPNSKNTLKCHKQWNAVKYVRQDKVINIIIIVSFF